MNLLVSSDGIDRAGVVINISCGKSWCEEKEVEMVWVCLRGVNAEVSRHKAKLTQLGKGYLVSRMTDNVLFPSYS